PRSPHANPHTSACILVPSSHLPPPPKAPLSPYTTLFRSNSVHGRMGIRRIAARCPGTGKGEPYDKRQKTGIRRTEPDRGPRTKGDRKSTRPNSSHVSISYAVFCLKRKTRDT